jgi:membrane protease subunit (stomatin/prohibitin family)
MKKLISTLALALALAPAAAAWADDMKGMDMSQGMAMGATPAAGGVSPSAQAKVKPPKKSKPKPAAKEEAQETWTCVMHPEIHLHHPGKCPKCGMDLVKEAKAPDKK